MEKKPLFRYHYWWAGISNYVYSTISVIKRIYIFLFIFSFVIDNAKPTCLDCLNNSIYRHLIIVEFTQNTLFYELEVLLYIFDINIVWDLRIYSIFHLSSTIGNLYWCLTLLIQLCATKIWYSFILIKFDIEKKWATCWNFAAEVSQAFSTCGKAKLVFVKY